MTFLTEARAPTSNARKYSLAVGKHWAHNLEVVDDGEAVRITFPKDARGADWPGDALVTLVPENGALVCRIEASAPAQRDGLKGAVERHVDRFAFREAPLVFEWRDQ
jgi:hypothetical protein